MKRKGLGRPLEFEWKKLAMQETLASSAVLLEVYLLDIQPPTIHGWQGTNININHNQVLIQKGCINVIQRMCSFPTSCHASSIAQHSTRHKFPPMLSSLSFHSFNPTFTNSAIFVPSPPPNISLLRHTSITDVHVPWTLFIPINSCLVCILQFLVYSFTGLFEDVGL